ncbi:MAG: hypothetical protein HY920_02415, partial [Elusimicrobia bacterium]|nr:hypothetical protein [Elusimicrobiota bacterium]
MLKDVFNPQNYQWNYYVAPMLVSAFLMFIVGFFVYLKKKDSFGLMYFIWVLSGAGWLLPGSFIMMAKTNELAMFLYNKIAFLLIAFISVN